MWRPPLSLGEEFVNYRLKQLNSDRFRKALRSGRKPPGLFLSDSSLTLICGLFLGTGLTLLYFLIFHGP